MQLLVSDTNILLDMESADLTATMFCINREFLVPDLLYERELAKRHAHFLALGLRVQALDPCYVGEECTLSIILVSLRRL